MRHLAKTKIVGASVLSIGTLSTIISPLCFAASQTATSTVTVNVNPTITLSATGPTITMDPNSTSTGNISTTISSNSSSGYTVYLKANSATTLAGPNSNTIPASGTITAGTDGWGVKCASETSGSTPMTCNKTSYTALTTSNVAFATAATTASSKSYAFTVGVSTAAAKPSGAYTRQITVTATTK